MGGGVTTARRLVRPRWLLGAGAVVLLLCGAWFWFRSSSLVAIRDVHITGVSGPHAAQIEVSLRRAAEGMTTLDFDSATLLASVRRFPDVHTLSASTSFPHGVEIKVDERRPIAELLASGTSIVVASDGTLMRGGPAPRGPLPKIPLTALPQGATLSGASAETFLRLLQAAPWQLLPHIRRVSHTAAHGIVASLRSGPSIYFGDGRALGAKWLAAVAVLAASGSAGASYIDVTDPQHPAAGVPVANSAGPPQSSTTTAAATNGIPAAGSTGTSSSASTGAPAG
jgi:cell division protein FtsQ